MVDYGRGASPLLSRRISCGIDAEDLSDCIQEETDISQCHQVAGVNCGCKLENKK